VKEVKIYFCFVPSFIQQCVATIVCLLWDVHRFLPFWFETWTKITLCEEADRTREKESSGDSSHSSPFYNSFISFVSSSLSVIVMIITAQRRIIMEATETFTFLFLNLNKNDLVLFSYAQ